MAYLFYIDNILLPVTPEKLEINIKNQNKTLNLINDGEVNILKQAGLSEISFNALLPNVSYPFAVYNNGFQTAKYYLEKLEELKINQQPFQFIVTRELPNKATLFNTNIKVSIEDYDIVEDSKNGFDVTIKVNLKQYKDYGTKVCTILNEDTETQITVNEVRETTTASTPVTTQTYTVKSGDSLWAIAKSYYGDGSKYTEIFNANSDKISNANLIYSGQVLTIPVL